MFGFFREDPFLRYDGRTFLDIKGPEANETDFFALLERLNDAVETCIYSIGPRLVLEKGRLVNPASATRYEIVLVHW